jgi:predicted  nucleic acid-binding Zn-ribbon protein
MILIGENWEKIRNLQDVSNIIREYYNSDLADEMDNLIPEHSDDEYEDLAFDLNNKEEKIISLEDEIDTLENKVETLEEKIEELENK